MSDERTLRLAHRPVTAEILAQYTKFIQLELEGKPAIEALQQAGLTADDVARTASAVDTFCRPRLLKRRLARATAKTPERHLKQLQELTRPIDDTGFVALYGEETHLLLLAQEDALVALRVRVVGESSV